MSGFEIVYADQPNPSAYRAGIRILARIAREILEERRLKQMGESVPVSCLNNTTETPSVKQLEGPQ